MLYRSYKTNLSLTQPEEAVLVSLLPPLSYLLYLWLHLGTAHSHVIGPPPTATASRWGDNWLSCSDASPTLKSKSAEAWQS